MIKYKDGYKYQTVEDSFFEIDLYQTVTTEYINLEDGKLFIKKGYAWDGPSGPAIDTRNFMQGSLVHDALYQLIRMKELEYDTREYADKLLRKMCIQDGMSRFRAWYVYQSVRKFGYSSAIPGNVKKVRTAP